MQRAYIPRPFIDAPLRSAERLGFATQNILQKAKISVEKLNTENGLSGNDYARLMVTIWTEMQDESMGLATVTSPYGTFAMMCKAIISCSTLEHALHRARRFYELFPQSPNIIVHKNEQVARIDIVHDSKNDPDHFLSESMLVVWHRLSSWLVGQGIPLLSVGCRYAPPEHAGLYQVLFGTLVRFNEPTTYLLLPTRALSLPISQTPASLNSFLKYSPADFLARPNPHASATGRIRQLFRRFPINNLPDLITSANLLDLSTATLRRRLSEEQTSFQTLKDECRCEEACHLLSQPDTSIQTIADHLGFTETSTFHRAFRKWLGVTPGEYRQQQGIH